MTTNHEIVVVGADDIAELLPVEAMIESQRRAFSRLSGGTAIAPERLLLPGAADSTAFCYAARLEESSSAVCKFGSVNPANAEQGLPSVSATVLVLDRVTGLPSCLIDGTAVTTSRTAAASALAVAELMAPGTAVLGVIGSGVQAEAHVRAVNQVVDLAEVRMFGIEQAHCRELCERLSDELGLAVVAVPSAREAVTEAGAVITCTTSATPVIEDEWIKPGATVVTIGSFAPDRSEIPPALMARADLLVVDHVPTAREHAGNLRKALEAGLIDDELVELGLILNGDHPGRTSDDQIILHTSVGVGIQDAAVAEEIAKAARERSERTTIAL